MKRLFRSLSRTNDGAFVIDGRHRIIFWNEAAETILGFRPEEVVGRQCYEILGGRDEQGRTLCQRYCQVAIKAQSGEALPNRDVYARTQTGEGRWLNLTAFTYPVSDKGSDEVIVHLFRDATVNKNYQRFVEQVLAASDTLQQEDNPEVSPSSRTQPHASGLTARELQVVELLAEGLDTDEIAKRLIISPATVRNHVQHILAKWGVHSRLEAVSHAYQLGLIQNSHR
jgi:PAS domain S-box-containing protein